MAASRAPKHIREFLGTFLFFPYGRNTLFSFNKYMQNKHCEMSCKGGCGDAYEEKTHNWINKMRAA